MGKTNAVSERAKLCPRLSLTPSLHAINDSRADFLRRADFSSHPQRLFSAGLVMIGPCSRQAHSDSPCKLMMPWRLFAASVGRGTVTRQLPPGVGFANFNSATRTAITISIPAAESVPYMSTYRNVVQGFVGAINAGSSADDERRGRVPHARTLLERCPYGHVFESRFGDAYNEEAFRYFLEIERRRSELSQTPFLLLLIDLKKQPGLGDTLDGVAAKLFSALSLSLRETDFFGWYHAGRVAGAVLTQHADGGGFDIPEIVSHRISAALRNGLPSDIRARIQVRVYQLPTGAKGEANV
jgi:hypothetical protein